MWQTSHTEYRRHSHNDPCKYGLRCDSETGCRTSGSHAFLQLLAGRSIVTEEKL